MALPSISIDDFNGEIRISKSIYNNYQGIIDKRYAKFVRDILSDQAFVDILNTDPLPKKYQDLFNGIIYFNTSCNKNLVQTGLRNACLYNLYFYLTREGGAINTPTGTQKNKSDNANPALNYRRPVQVYNEGVRLLYDEIYPFISNYEKLSTKVISSVDLGGNNYTINVSDTTYLSDADNVKIGNVNYLVSNLVDNTSFDVQANATGLDFSSRLVTWCPFFEFNMPCELEIF